MKIPSRFQLLGREVRVRFMDAGEWLGEADSVGLWHRTSSEIHILRTNQELMEHTFWHELTHAMLEAMGREKLSKDEAFVDLLSGLIHQVLKTTK